MSFYRLFILFYDRIRSGTIAGAKNLPDFVFPKLPLGEGSGESETIPRRLNVEHTSCVCRGESS